MIDLKAIFAPIADKLKLKFGSGGQVDFDNACNDIQSPDTVLLFLELYDDFSLTVDAYGIGDVKPFVIFVVKKGAVQEEPLTRYPKILDCEAVTINILRLLLDTEGTIVGGNASPVLSVTTNAMSGIRFNGSYKKTLSLCVQ